MTNIKSFSEFYREIYIVEWKSNGQKKSFKTRKEAEEYWNYSEKLQEEPKLYTIKPELLNENK